MIRGCQHEPPARLLESMRAHFRLPTTPAEWGLSVASMPSGTEAAILKAAGQLRQSHYRVASVEALSELSDPWVYDTPFPDPDDAEAIAAYVRSKPAQRLHVEWDHNAHALILASVEPTLELAGQIAELFGPPIPNPYYEERRRSRASR